MRPLVTKGSKHTLFRRITNFFNSCANKRITWPLTTTLLILFEWCSFTVWTLQTQLFQDNSHVGRFVNGLADDLESWRPPTAQPAAASSSRDSSGVTAGTSPTAAAPREITIDGSEGSEKTGCVDDDGDDDGEGDGDGSGGGALERLWVKDADGRSVLFADVSVYTRCVWLHWKRVPHWLLF